MDIRVTRADLVKEFGLARRLADRKMPIPVYGYALLEPDADGLHIHATDGESALLTRCDVRTDKPGKVLVPVRTLHEMAKAATADDVQLAVDGKRVKVNIGSFRSVLQTMPVEDFPQLPSSPPAEAALSAKVLRQAISRVRFVTETATSAPTTYFMHGALLESDEGGLRMVATDGRRLALVEAPTAGAVAQALIPRKTLDDLSALLDDAEGDEVGYARDESRVFFSVGPRMLISRVIDATFPAYKRVIPAQNGDHAVSADRDVWLGALRRVMLVSTTNASKVALTVAPGMITASMGAADVGEAAEPIPAEVVGDGWESGFDCHYLADFLNAAGGGKISLEQQAPTKAGAFRAEADDIKYTYVLMPMGV